MSGREWVKHKGILQLLSSVRPCIYVCLHAHIFICMSDNPLRQLDQIIHACHAIEVLYRVYGILDLLKVVCIKNKMRKFSSLLSHYCSL